MPKTALMGSPLAVIGTVFRHRRTLAKTGAAVGGVLMLQALSEGCPVISSQRAGLFTSGGHFIVLRGVTANGKVLVNDPNDSDAKNYINREFDMMSEIHATANAYWIFDKK